MASEQRTKLQEAVDKLLERSLGQTGYAQAFAKADPAIKKLAEQRRAASQSLAETRSQMRTNPELAGLDPNQREALIAAREGGIGNQISQYGDLEKQQYGTATQRAGIAYEGQQLQYTKLQDMLNRVKEEEAAAEEQRRWQMEYALNVARLGQSGGGSGGYGSSGLTEIGELPPELLRAFQLDIDANLEGRADNALPYETLVAGYAADSNLSEGDRARLIKYATDRKAQLAGEQTQNTPTGNWFSNTFGGMGGGVPQNSYTQYLTAQRLQKPNWGVQSSNGEDTSGNTTTPGAAYRGW